MSRKNDRVSAHCLSTPEERVVTSRHRMTSEDERGAARSQQTSRTHTHARSSTNEEELRATQRPSPHHRHGTAVARPRQEPTIPGAVAVAGLDASSDQGTVFYRTADDNTTVYTRHVDNNSEVPVTARAVDDDEENLLRHDLDEVRERVLMLQERERLREANAVTAQVVTANDEEQPANENEEEHNGGIFCGSSNGCRKTAIVAAFLALLIVAIVAPVVLIQRPAGEPLTPTPSPTTPPTTAPTTITQGLNEFLCSISSDECEALLTPGTPQNQAVHWLVDNANLGSYSNDQIKQRFALAVFYYSTNGDSWTNRDNWLDDGEECDRWWQSEVSTLQCTDLGAWDGLTISEGPCRPRLNCSPSRLSL